MELKCFWFSKSFRCVTSQDLVAWKRVLQKADPCTGGNAKSGPTDDYPEGIKNYYQATVLCAVSKRFMVRF